MRDTIYMFSWRAKRHLFIFVLLFLIIGGGAAWGTYKLFPVPTCFDNIRNQGEGEIDCGGSCAPCALRNPQEITVFWARAIPMRPNSYDAAAEIQNPNEALSSASVEYEFTLFDTRGPIAVRRGKTFLFAQERTMVVEAGLETTREPASVEFKILNVDWIARSDPKPNVMVERHEYVKINEGRPQSAVDVSLVNDTPFNFRNFEIIVTAFDRNGNLIGANRVGIEGFDSESRKKIRTLWPILFAEDPATIRIEPRVNLFNPEVIINR